MPSVEAGGLSPWVTASRPATLWAAVVPVLVGGSLAFDDDVFRWDIFIVTLLAATAIQISTNFANDASDARRGADTADRLGPTRVVSTGLLTSRQVWTGVWAMFGLAATGGIYLASQAGWIVIVIGVVSIAAALGYTGGPRPYGYAGLGEVFVFIFFGVVATVGSRYVHDSSAPADAWWLSVPIGLLATAILVANNVRDIPTDQAAGKNTLAVRLGREKSEQLYAALLAGGTLLPAIGAIARVVPPGAIASVVAVVGAIGLIRKVRAGAAGQDLIPVLRGTAQTQLAVGLLVAGGITVVRVVG